ncbi:MAG: FAD-dependent oxidoreductase [Porticoccaceae bacterium]|nr:FAD-dependent oxidoreductase [Porticoccaceae bacterium]
MSTHKVSPISPLKASSVSRWDYETDVVVIGCGGAGACAAISAHDAGSRVLIFELASGIGGSTALSSAEVYLGGGTRVQKATGHRDTKRAMTDFLTAAAGPQADKAKIVAYVAGSTDHFDWLVEQGVVFKDSEYPHRAIMALTDDCLLYTGGENAHPYNKLAPPAPRGHNLKVAGDNGGPLLMNTLGARIDEKSIPVELNSRALALIVDDSDDQQSVIGVQVRIDMQERYVKARSGVILASGGFVMNDQMVKQYAPELAKCTVPIGNPGDTGSGILMGMGVGGAAINMHEGFVSLPFYPPASLTYGVFINSQGQRFVNEDSYHGRVGSFILRETGGPVYLVLAVEDYGKYETESYLNADVAATAESIAELESDLNLPPGELQATMSDYNKHAEAGNDELFHKDPVWLKPLEPPFVALDVTPGRGAFYPYFTLGGLDTLPTGEVLKASGDVITGLYAVGRTACGIPRRGEGYASGMSVGDATFTGRQAGMAAATRTTTQGNTNE